MRKYPKIHAVYHRVHGSGEFDKTKYSMAEIGYLADDIWNWTEKVDGMNIRVGWDCEEAVFAGRTDKATIPPELLNYLTAVFTPSDMEPIFGSHVTLFGEGYGRGIQKDGEKYRDTKGFILFDVLHEASGIYLSRDSMIEVALGLGVMYAPRVMVGTIGQAERFVAGRPKSWVSEQEREMEGVVGQPAHGLRRRTGERIITKIKVKDYT